MKIQFLVLLIVSNAAFASDAGPVEPDYKHLFVTETKKAELRHKIKVIEATFRYLHNQIYDPDSRLSEFQQDYSQRRRQVNPNFFEDSKLILKFIKKQDLKKIMLEQELKLLE